MHPKLIVRQGRRSRTMGRLQQPSIPILGSSLTRRCAIALCFLQACAIRKSTKTVVGFSQMENNNPWRIAETNSMREEAARRRAQLDIVVTTLRGRQRSRSPTSRILWRDGFRRSFSRRASLKVSPPPWIPQRELKIPIFLIDREAAGTPGQDYVCFIGSDFVQQARRVADWLIAHTGGKASIVELTGTPGSSVARDRSRGFAERIASHPAMRIIASQTADFSRAAAQNVMQNIVQARGNEITCVYAHNDEMAIGAIQA